MEFSEFTILMKVLKDTKLHIILNNGRWLNGVIADVSGSFLIFSDEKDGLLPIEIKHISKITEWRKK